MVDKLLTAVEAAEFLGVKLSTIRKMTCRRLLPCIRPTGRRCVRYSQRALEALIRQRTQPALPDAA